jgi:hypothetical protein
LLAPAAPSAEESVLVAPETAAASYELAASSTYRDGEKGCEDAHSAGFAPEEIGSSAALQTDAVIDSTGHQRSGGSQQPYNARTFGRHTKAIPWRVGGAAAAITAAGVANWNWGSSPFRFQSEGWFGKDTASGGMDKLGHAYTTYVLTEFFTDGIPQSRSGDHSRSYTAAILAMGLMTYIEVFDGFSKDHGFSHEDLAVDAAGAVFSIARRSVPGAREKVDFRLLYIPTRSALRSFSCFPAPHCDQDGQTARTPITDYAGQRYLFALKLSGFERFRGTPLRLLEIHGGYYARGFTKEEEDRGDPLKRRLFTGVGLNVSELIFGARRPLTGLGRAAKSALEYLQLPYTALHSQ